MDGDTASAVTRPWWCRYRVLLGAATLLLTVDVIRLIVLSPHDQPAFTDGFETAVAVLCALFCWRAAVGSSDVSKRLWAIVALFFVLLAVADFHDFLLDVSPQSSARAVGLLEFLGWCAYPSLAVLIFFPTVERDRGSGLSVVQALDFLQVALVVAVAYFRYVYLAHAVEDQPWTVVQDVDLLRDGVISIGLLLRAALDSVPRVRAFYLRTGGVFAAVAFFRAVSVGTPYQLALLGRPAAWMALAVFAARWTADSASSSKQDRQILAIPWVSNLMRALAPVVIIGFALGTPEVYQGFMMGAIGASVLLFAGRSALAEHAWRTAEERIRASEEKFRKAFRTGAAAFYLATLEDGRIIDVNDRFPDVFGYSRQEALGKTELELRLYVEPEDRRKMVAALKESGAVRDLEVQCRKKGGEPITVLVSAGALLLNGDHLLLGVVRDITEQKRSYAALGRLRHAVDASGEVVFMTDHEGVITFVNPEFTRLYGYTAEEVIGKTTPRILKSGEADPSAYQEFWELLLAKQRVQDEIVNRTKDGRQVTVERSANAVLDEQGEVLGFISIQRDVTGRKLLEQQFQQAQKMEAVGRLAGGVAHDFNNLLGIVGGYTELLMEDEALAERSKQRLAEIKKAVDRAVEVTRQLLAFSRKQVVQTSILDLNAVVRDTSRMLARLLGEDIELNTVLAPELGSIEADPTGLTQIILNLAVNARDAMPHGGKLIIETANVALDYAYAERHAQVPAGDYVMLVVADTGAGMDAETQRHVFEPFFTTKEMGHGTGLGLSTVYGIVQQSGGHIWIYSELGHGTTFKIYFPRLGVAASALRTKAAEALPRGSETILLVEDDPGLRELNVDVLRDLGYHVLEAANGAEAIAAVERHTGPLHLLMTDVVMPGMNGRELAGILLKSRPTLRVLFVSGYANNIVQSAVLESGLAYLQKPFGRQALAAKLREILDKTE